MQYPGCRFLCKREKPKACAPCLLPVLKPDFFFRMTSMLAKRRWYRWIPLAGITYSLANLDRANFGFAAAGHGAGYKITPSVSSLPGSLFFLGYFYFQLPGALYAANKSAKQLLFWFLLFWGGLTIATGTVNSISILMAVRTPGTTATASHLQQSFRHHSGQAKL